MTAVSTEVGAVETPRTQAGRGHLPGEPSMWFFVIGDLLIFAFYFVVYMYYRGQNQELFLDSQAKLNTDIGALNTVVLLTSSLFVALGTWAARTGKTSDAYRLLWLAWICGAAFPVLKAFEYVPEILAGVTPGTNLFFMFYFVMTGMHLCHVFLGLAILYFVVRNVGSGQPRLKLIETGAIYWHMVDLLWIVLFALLYLMR